MKKILIALFAVIAAVSCNDDTDKGKPAPLQVYPTYKNSQRVSAVEGKNKRWGEFRMDIYYGADERLDSIWIIGSDDRRKGAIINSRFNNASGKGSIKYIYDYLDGISQDSIERLDLALEAKYGKGNYSLLDSIPKAARAIQTINTSYYADNRVASVTIGRFVPRKYIGVSGVDFSNAYIKIKDDKLRYEYNARGLVIAVRTISDDYEVDFVKNTSVFKKSEIYKQVISYDGDKVVRVEDCVLNAGESFSTVVDYVFNFNGKEIGSISHGGKSTNFSRSGNKLTITNDGVVMNYELNAHGYPTKIDDGAGNYMNISYQNGHGDFDDLAPILNKVLGIPYIR